MELFPAIDIWNGQAVRLEKGDFNKMKVYYPSALTAAKKIKDEGAKNIHIVDLEGAKVGSPKNFEIIEKIKKETNLFIEVGGGIRDIDKLKKYIDCGIDRIILGTSALNNIDYLNKALSLYNNNIAIGADIKDGYIATNGWTTTSSVYILDFCNELINKGAKYFIVTDISKDGMLKGTNLELYNQLKNKLECNIIASGGISSISDIAELNKLNIYGAIIGKAYYENKINLKEAISLV